MPKRHISQSEKADLANTVFIGVIIVMIFAVPALFVPMASVFWVYGMEQGSQLLAGSRIFDTYKVLFPYLLEHWEAHVASNMPFVTKMVVPIGASLVTSLIIMFIARAPLLDFRPFKPEEALHGDAHWATRSEIKRAGLLDKEGVLLGQYAKGKYYIAGGFQHILLFAPTGSGKGVGFAIPNLLFWEQSTCVHDIKLENYELASGWRASQGQDVYVWNPADPDGITHCYNPMDWISTKPGQMVDDCQKMCNMLLPEQEFWQNEARALLLGVMLYLVAVPEKKSSFGEIVRTMRSDDVTYNLAVVLDTIGKKIHPVGYMNIASFLQKADKERSGVSSTLNSSLELWSNPLIDTATASSDFNVAMWKKKKITVYCGVTPDNLQRLQPLLQVFYQQCTDILTRKMPQPDEPYGVLFLLDEFPTLGKMPQFEAGIAYFRGYRVRLFLIVQDTQQLKGIYEEAGMNSFLSNATYRITFAANNIETANLISQMIGNKTVKQESHNRPQFMDMNPASRTKHVSETQRALLLPQEVIGLPRDEEIILIESQPPIRCKKIAYYKDSFFTKRLMDPTHVPQQEPYDPRKKDGEKKDADKPDAKPDEAKQQPKAKPDDKKPEAKQSKPPAPDKGKTAPPPKETAKKVESKQDSGKANPFDLPPAAKKSDANAPKDKAAAGGSKPDKKATPFDLPPVPTKKPGADAKPEVKQQTQDKAKATPSETKGEKATAKKSANPFDLPPIPPKKKTGSTPSKTDKDKDSTAKEAANPAKETQEKNQKKPAAKANPFDLPPIPPKKKTDANTPKTSKPDESNTDDGDASSNENTNSGQDKQSVDKAAKAPAKKAANPFDLPPIPPKKKASSADTEAKESAKPQTKTANPQPAGTSAPAKKDNNDTAESNQPEETPKAKDSNAKPPEQQEKSQPKPAKDKATNPFDLPPIPQKKKVAAKTERQDNEDQADVATNNDAQSTEDESSSDNRNPAHHSDKAETPAAVETAKAGNNTAQHQTNTQTAPFGLPPIPPKAAAKKTDAPNKVAAKPATAQNKKDRAEEKPDQPSTQTKAQERQARRKQRLAAAQKRREQREKPQNASTTKPSVKEKAESMEEKPQPAAPKNKTAPKEAVKSTEGASPFGMKPGSKPPLPKPPTPKSPQQSEQSVAAPQTAQTTEKPKEEAAAAKPQAEAKSGSKPSPQNAPTAKTKAATPPAAPPSQAQKKTQASAEKPADTNSNTNQASTAKTKPSPTDKKPAAKESHGKPAAPAAATNLFSLSHKPPMPKPPAGAKSGKKAGSEAELEREAQEIAAKRQGKPARPEKFGPAIPEPKGTQDRNDQSSTDVTASESDDMESVEASAPNDTAQESANGAVEEALPTNGNSAPKPQSIMDDDDEDDDDLPVFSGNVHFPGSAQHAAPSDD